MEDAAGRKGRAETSSPREATAHAFIRSMKAIMGAALWNICLQKVKLRFVMHNAHGPGTMQFVLSSLHETTVVRVVSSFCSRREAQKEANLHVNFFEIPN